MVLTIFVCITLPLENDFVYPHKSGGESSRHSGGKGIAQTHTNPIITKKFIDTVGPTALTISTNQSETLFKRG